MPTVGWFACGGALTVALRVYIHVDRWRESGGPWNWRAVLGPGAYAAWSRRGR